jgi:hypothetical protein
MSVSGKLADSYRLAAIQPEVHLARFNIPRASNDYGQTFSGVTELTGATVKLLNPAITGQFTLDIASGGIVVNAALTGGGSLTVQGASFANNVGAGFEQVFSGLASGSMVSGGTEIIYGGVGLEPNGVC